MSTLSASKKKGLQNGMRIEKCKICSFLLVSYSHTGALQKTIRRASYGMLRCIQDNRISPVSTEALSDCELTKDTIRHLKSHQKCS